MLRQARSGPQKSRWDALVRAAEESLKTPLIPEPPGWTDGKWNAPEWRQNFLATVKAVEIAENLAFCYLLSGDQRYGAAADVHRVDCGEKKLVGATGFEPATPSPPD